MNLPTRLLVGSVIGFHVLAFVVESILWMEPTIHEFVVRRLSVDVALDPHGQAEVLRTLFLNQGFYNLLLASGGLAGWILTSKGHTAAGRALICNMCLFAMGGGCVLALSTPAYAAAFLQAGPAAAALVMIVRAQRTARS